MRILQAKFLSLALLLSLPTLAATKAHSSLRITKWTFCWSLSSAKTSSRAGDNVYYSTAFENDFTEVGDGLLVNKWIAFVKENLPEDESLGTSSCYRGLYGTREEVVSTRSSNIAGDRRTKKVHLLDWP